MPVIIKFVLIQNINRICINSIKPLKMSILRFIGILITITFLSTSCSQKVSQIDYDRKNYEYDQLKIRYDLLRQETDGKKTETVVNKVTSEVDFAEYEEMQQNYETLLTQHQALENAYNELHEKQQKAQPVETSNTISEVDFNELKAEKTALEKRYAILEHKYNSLKEVANESNVASNEIVEPLEIDPDLNIGKGTLELEENSIDLGSMIVQSASHNGLFFDFDDYDRTEEYLVLEVAIKNNSQNHLKTFWNAEKIQIIDKSGNTYTANYFRVGVDYASQIDNTLMKKIKDENTVYARFAFEELPSDFKHIQSLKFIVIIDGEERAVEFTQIDISKIEND